MNALSLYQTYVKKKFTSTVPLLGGLFGLAGFFQIPPLRKWCWIAVLLDYGSVVFFLAVPKLAREIWQTSRINLVGEFVGGDEGKQVKIRLYKAGVLVIKHEIARKAGEPGLVNSSDIGSWRKRDGAIILMLRNDRVQMRQIGEIWRVDRSFQHYEQDRDLEIEHIDFKGTF
jgi:hypothetical protein